MARTHGGGTVGPNEFRKWRERMGKLTIQQTADKLRISFSSARQYGEGMRTVPDYIALLCEQLENAKLMETITMNAPKKGSKQPADIASLMAAAYIQARRKKNPSLAATLTTEVVQDDMQHVIETLIGQGFTINAKTKDKQAAG